MHITATPKVHRLFPAYRLTRQHGALSTYSQSLVAVFLLAGVVLRLYHYFDNRSLWLDEIYLSTSIVKMSFLELASPLLDFQQKAPIGYLWSVKLCTLILGNNEFGLRLFSLLTGIASLFLFVPVCRHFLKEHSVWIGVALLALAPHLVYHSVEAKQYSTECFGTIAALYLYTRFGRKEDLRSALLWGFWGSLLVWFSYSVIFILAGIALTMGIRKIYRKEWKDLLIVGIPGTLWLANFAASYLFFTNKQVDSQWLVHWFSLRNAFVHFPPTSLSELAQPFQVALTRILGYPLGLLWEVEMGSNPILQVLFKRPSIALLCIGTATVFLLLNRKRALLLIVMPFLLTLAASAIKMYPIYERLTVFLAPLLILLIALGCGFLMYRTPAKWKVKYWLPVLLLAPVVFEATRQMIDTRLFSLHKKAYYKEVFGHLDQHVQQGDLVYLYWNMKAPYRLYNSMKGYRFSAIEGTDVRNVSTSTADYLNRLQPDFQKLAGHKRVWVTFSKFHVIEIGDYDMKPEWYFNEAKGGRALQTYMDTHFKKLQQFETRDLRLLLYDCSEKL